MHANSKAIYYCTFAPATFQVPSNVKLTYNAAAKRLYVHLFEYPTAVTLLLPGYKGKIKYAQFLHDNSEMKMKEQGNDILLTMPQKKPGYEIPVVELSLN